MGLQKIEDHILLAYKQTLRECSEDDSGEPVTLSEQEAFQFDGLSALEAERYRRKKKLCSADAFYIKNEKEMFFFEFKNTRKSHVSWKSVQQKAHDSLLTMQVLMFPELSLQECADRTSYFLNYNDGAVKEHEPPSFGQIKAKMGRLAEEEDTYPVLGGMEVFKDTFYKKVYTIDISSFEEQFLDIIYEGGSDCEVEVKGSIV